MNNAINLLDLMNSDAFIAEVDADLADRAARRAAITARVTVDAKPYRSNCGFRFILMLDGKPVTRVMTFNRAEIDADAAQLVLSLTLAAGCAA